MIEATDPEARRQIAEYWNAKETGKASSSPLDIENSRIRQYRAAAWIAGGVNLRPHHGRIPTLDEIDQGRNL